MPCSLCGLDSPTYIRCLCRSLGVPETPKWSLAAHEALYRALSVQADILSARSEVAYEIRQTPWGKEPETTGAYVRNYPVRYLAPGDPFWNCMGIEKDTAVSQMLAAEGPFYRAAMAAGNNARIDETGLPDKGSGIWPWIIGGAVGIGALYLLLRK